MRRNISRRRTPKLVSATAVLAGACSLVGGSALALELGDFQVESALGQALRASVGFTLGPNEQMFNFCVRLRQGITGGPIPSVTRAKVSVVGSRIVFTGDVAVKDPLLNMQVVIDCPYTPQLTRQYTLIVDPVEYFQEDVVLAAEPAPFPVTPAAGSIQVPEAVADTQPVAIAANDHSPIEVNTEYRVQSGDSASVIAARIEGRTNSLQSAIAILVANNPDAFLEGNAARLMAGSLLTIPAMTDDAVAAVSEPAMVDVEEYAPEPVQVVAVPVQDTPVQAAPEPIASVTPPSLVQEPVVEVEETVAPLEEATATVEAPLSSFMAETPSAPVEPAELVADPGILSEPGEEIVTSVDAASESNATAEPAIDELQPGDFVVPPVAETSVADATESAAPVVAAPVVSTANSSSQSSNSWSWLIWPIGGALLLVGGILLLGRQIREKFASVAIGAPQESAATHEEVEVEAEVEAEAEAIAEAVAAPEPQPAPAADATLQMEVPEPVIDDVDFELDDTISSEAISLDADLDAGTGLTDSQDLDVAQDFGFAASGQVEHEVDHEFPDEAASNAKISETDIIAPSHKENAPSILVSEVAPEDDYDMSMIVDATKQNIDDTQLTAQDLQAVPLDLDSSDTYSISDDTLASDADLEALEQDYQEEFTQTLALNEEIEKAAQELAAKLDDDIVEDIADDDPTADEPILTIEDPGLDPMAEIPARQPEDELTTEMPARTFDSDVTAEMPEQTSVAEVTAELVANIAAENDDVADDDIADDAVTSKLVAAGNEPTVEMQIETVIADLKDDE